MRRRWERRRDERHIRPIPRHLAARCPVRLHGHRLQVHDLLQQTGGVGHPAEVHGPSGPRLHMGRLPGARLRQDAGAVEPDLDGVVPDFRVRAGSGAAIRDVLRYGRAFHGRNLDPRRPQGA